MLVEKTYLVNVKLNADRDSVEDQEFGTEIRQAMLNQMSDYGLREFTISDDAGVLFAERYDIIKDSGLDQDSDAALTPAPNVKLLNRILDIIETDPDHWDQETWVTETPCGTAYCFAGWAVHLNGYKFHPGWDLSLNTSDEVYKDNEKESIYIQDVAQEILGLTLLEATTLFSSWRTLDDIRAVVAHIIARGQKKS